MVLPRIHRKGLQSEFSNQAHLFQAYEVCSNAAIHGKPFSINPGNRNQDLAVASLMSRLWLHSPSDVMEVDAGNLHWNVAGTVVHV